VGNRGWWNRGVRGDDLMCSMTLSLLPGWRARPNFVGD
jgi:hypothetical protein